MSYSYVVRCCCSAPGPVKPVTVAWLWVPLRQVQLARQVNSAASGAPDSASRAPSKAATFTPLSTTGLSVVVIGVSLVSVGSDGRLSRPSATPELRGVLMQPLYGHRLSSRYRGIPLHGRYG